MQAKHTPGPWTKGRFGHLRGSNGSYVLVSNLFIASDNGTSDPEYEANARLIAAAPELLEALQAMMKHFASIAGDCTDKQQALEEIRAVGIARAVIFAATGEPANG